MLPRMHWDMCLQNGLAFIPLVFWLIAISFFSPIVHPQPTPPPGRISVTAISESFSKLGLRSIMDLHPRQGPLEVNPRDLPSCPAVSGI